MITRFLSCTALVASVAASPGLAGDSDSDIIQLSVRPGWTSSNGRQTAALHMTLAPGWKTYWRAPGDAGIPPTITWSESNNIDTLDVIWPAPVIFDQSGFQSIGYTDMLVLPLRITPDKSGQKIRLKGEIDLGVCSDICIPRTLIFDQIIDVGNTTPDPVIAAAIATAPRSAKKAGVKSAICQLSAIDGGLRIKATIKMPSAGGTEIAIIEPGDPQIWASAGETERSGAQLTTYSDLYHASQSVFALDRSAVRITVLGGKYSVDIQGCTPS